MKLLSKTGDPNIAEVFVAQFRGDPRLMAEFVDSRDPALPKKDKWVVIVSTQFGCPVECLMCDSGGNYRGDLTSDEIFAQIDNIVVRHPKGLASHCKKFKIQFARMGEPALNPAVLDVIRELPNRYDNPNIIPCIATTAPLSASAWFDKLLEIKKSIYAGKLFQLQFSINSTDENERDRLMPVPKWNLSQIAQYGNRFVENGDRKVSLNFALTEGVAVDTEVISRHFDPKKFCIKITPLNPTETASASGLKNAIPLSASHNEASDASNIMRALGQKGFDVILSIGEPKENQIGSNCGQAVKKLAHKTKNPQISQISQN